jgi:LacI family transcriptional regulator
VAVRSPVTIREVAAAAGVSVATVSRALNGRGDVRAATAERVSRAAARLGYRPSAAARTLPSGSSGLVAAVVSPCAGDAALHQPFVRAVLAGFGVAAAAAGRQVLTLETAGERGVAARCREHRVAGAVLLGFGSADGAVAELVASELPVVALDLELGGGDPPGLPPDPGLDAPPDPGLDAPPDPGLDAPPDPGPGAPPDPGPGAPPDPSLDAPSAAPTTARGRATWVGGDHARGAALAVDHLAALGHRRIALLPGVAGCLPARERERGWRAAMRERGLRDDLVVCGDFTATSGFAAAAVLLSRPPADRPTAFVTGSDELAAGVVRAAAEAGLRVPGDVSVVGFDDLPLARWTTPPLTTVHQDPLALGAAAAEALERCVAGEPSPPVTVPVALVVRDSTAPPPR